LSCARLIPNLILLCRLLRIAQFLQKSLCDFYSETVQATEPQILVVFEKFHSSAAKTDGPNPWIRAVFFLLIMSMAQMGVILCKLSGRGRRYERTMDFGNERAN
jgi:hypothetical protein